LDTKNAELFLRFKPRRSVENKPHTGRHRLLDERDTRVLVRLVRSDRKTPLKDVTTRFNENRDSTFLMSFDNCLRFPAMMNISTFCPNIAEDRFIFGLILKIEGLKYNNA
jgi:hypothetical protein